MGADRQRWRFDGHIAGVGSASGVRVVVGWWHDTPLGSFADAMVETARGHRVLLAPTPDVARLIAGTYDFDEIRVEPFAATGDPGRRWRVRSASLRLDLEVGRRTPLGALLRAVPTPLAGAPAWCALTDPVARTVLRGVRTRGTTGTAADPRREWYGALDRRRVTAMSGTFDDAGLGDLRPVLPAPRFGFSSTPPTPGVTRVRTTIEARANVPLRG
ncbi:hypothetical protein [Nocardioides sp.]|uniref:hypothetical protein n=1 Tax=Nocardioides sp. TaxID=35761 RepID=UPI003513BDCE